MDVRSWWPLLVCGIVSMLAAAVICLQPGSWREQPWWFACGGLVMGGAMLAGLYVVRTRTVPRHAVTWILFVSGVLLLMGTQLALSDDVARYTLEGRQLWSGQNPYAVAPVQPQAQALVSADLYQQISHPEMTAIYQPLALCFHAVVQGLWAHPRGFTAAALGAVIVTIVLVLTLLRRTGRDPALVLTLAWNPVVVLFGVGEGHNDVIMGLLLVTVLCVMAASRPTMAVLITGCALLVKPFAVVLLPALWPSTGWRRWVWLVPLSALAYLPFFGAGSGLVASLFTFGGSLHFHGVIDPWLRLGFNTLLGTHFSSEHRELLIRIVLICLLISGWWWLYRRSAAWSRPTCVAYYAAWMLACLPTLHPWYFMVLAVVLPFSQGWALPVWTACATIYWLHGMRILELGTWTETPWVTTLAHLPAIITLAIELIWSHLTRIRVPATAADPHMLHHDNLHA